MAIPNSSWVEIPGICLRYELSGAGSDVLVLVHEMAGCLESWDDVMPALSARFRVLRFDQRGFGMSEKKLDLSMANARADLLGLLDALDMTQPVIMAGAALGASVCLSFACHHPTRVKSLILSSPATGGMTEDAIRGMESRVKRVRGGEWHEISEEMFKITYPSELPFDRLALHRHRLRWLTTAPEAFVAINRMMASFDLSSELPRILCPTLIIGCEFDGLRSPARSAEIAASIPGSQFTKVKSGHYLPIQHPHLFVESLVSFACHVGTSPSSPQNTQ